MTIGVGRVWTNRLNAEQTEIGRKNPSELKPKLPSGLLAKLFWYPVGRLMARWRNRGRTVVSDSLNEYAQAHENLDRQFLEAYALNRKKVTK